MDTVRRARDTGELAVDQFVGAIRANVQQSVRRSLGVRGSAPPTCNDPALSYLPVNGAARRVHGDLPSMLIGGIASLLLQLLHPEVMAGVAQHSRYQEDPLGRLARTASFVGTTTFGSAVDAAAAVARVRAVHGGVVGVTDRGDAYRANDPHLLEWVHVSELSMFLAGVQTYGPHRLSDNLRDQYVAEMAKVALDLGVIDPPQSFGELNERIESFRSELRLIDEGRSARSFVLRGVTRSAHQRAAYATMVTAAVGIMPTWARRQLEIPSVPFVDSLLVRPAATVLCSTLRLAVPTRERTSRND